MCIHRDNLSCMCMTHWTISESTSVILLLKWVRSFSFNWKQSCRLHFTCDWHSSCAEVIAHIDLKHECELHAQDWSKISNWIRMNGKRLFKSSVSKNAKQLTWQILLHTVHTHTYIVPFWSGLASPHVGLSSVTLSKSANSNIS